MNSWNILRLSVNVVGNVSKRVQMNIPQDDQVDQVSITSSDEDANDTFIVASAGQSLPLTTCTVDTLQWMNVCGYYAGNIVIVKVCLKPE